MKSKLSNKNLNNISIYFNNPPDKRDNDWTDTSETETADENPDLN